MLGALSLVASRVTGQPIALSSARSADVAAVADLAAFADLAAVALQAGERLDGAAAVALQAYEFVGVALGLFIAYLAYRGYRRNESRPMLFVAVGFLLVLGLPVPLFVGYLLLPGVSGPLLQAVVQTVEMAGLLCIVYALRMEP